MNRNHIEDKLWAILVSWKDLGSSYRCSNAFSFLVGESALALVTAEVRSESEAVLRRVKMLLTFC